MIHDLLPRLAIFIWFLAIGVTVFGTFLGLMHLQARPEVRADASLFEPITILKPLKGVDEGIEVNLESFMNLDYPEFEILFSVVDPTDPVVKVVKSVIARHPDVQADLLIGAGSSGPNPKINNMIRSYEQASYDWILISDSNTRVFPTQLRSMASEFKNGVAMQTSVVAGINAHGVGGHLESVFLNTFYTRSLLVMSAFRHPCVIGKAMMFRKSVLERTGGLRSLEIHMAEDYAAGRRLHLLGFRVQVSRTPIQQHLGRHGFGSFWGRHIRWGRLRKMQAPLGFALEPLFNMLVSGILGAFAFSKLYGLMPLTFFAAHLIIWFIADALLYARVTEKPRLNFAPAWALRELLHIPLWVHIAAGKTIVWRGKKIRLVKPKQVLPHHHMLQGLHEFLRHPHLPKPTEHAPMEMLTEAYTQIDDGDFNGSTPGLSAYSMVENAARSAK